MRRVKPEKFRFANRMRRHPTEEESIVWERLREKRVGYRFRRQAPLFGFIVDFYCPKMKVVVEVDGGWHGDNRNYDARRDRVMTAAGLCVLHFTNDDVLDGIDRVVAKIVAACDEYERHRSSFVV